MAAFAPLPGVYVRGRDRVAAAWVFVGPSLVLVSGWATGWPEGVAPFDVLAAAWASLTILGCLLVDARLRSKRLYVLGDDALLIFSGGDLRCRVARAGLAWITPDWTDDRGIGSPELPESC